MENQRINEERVDAAFANIEKLRQSARNLTVSEVAALSERVRIEIILDKTMSKSRKRWYRAYTDYLDDVVNDRMEKEGIERDNFQNWIIQYLRRILGDD